MTLIKIIFFLQFYFLLSLLSVNADSGRLNSDEKKVEELANSVKWQKLLYFEKGKSIVDSPDFFLSTVKKKSPSSEARASYIQMFVESSEINDKHAICKFPARFMMLAEALGRLKDFSKIRNCKKLSAFMKRMTGQSVSLVFSSYYLNNPSSAFGHTLLKVNRSESSDLDLLNYGINYSATVGDENALFFALKGLLGFFKGEFTAVPYYYKVREYNDYESRDLWEYKLNLSAKEIAMLHMHIWELGRGWSKYYFLSGNCSYWAIKVLEAIKPEYELSKHFGSAFVIPAETLKSLYKFDDFVREIKYRPSMRKQLLSKLEKLNKSEVKRVRRLANQINKSSVKLEDLSEDKAEVLEASVLLFDYSNSKGFLTNEEEFLGKKQVILNARSKLPQIMEERLEADFKNAPHLSHSPRRVGLSYLETNQFNKSSFLLNYKQGYHSLLDSRVGFNPHMGLNYFDLSLLFQEDSESGFKIDLNHFYLVNIETFSPMTKLDQNFSWRLNLGVDSERFTRSLDRQVGFLNFDSGVSYELFGSSNLLLYGLISNTLEVNGRFENSLRVSVSPLLGFKYTFLKNTNLITEARYAFFSDFSNDVLNSIQVDTKFQSYNSRFGAAVYLNNSYVHSKGVKDQHITSFGLSYFF